MYVTLYRIHAVHLPPMPQDPLISADAHILASIETCNLQPLAKNVDRDRNIVQVKLNVCIQLKKLFHSVGYGEFSLAVVIVPICAVSGLHIFIVGRQPLQESQSQHIAT